MVHQIFDHQDIERLITLQTNFGKSLIALSDVVKQIVEHGGIDAVAALPDEERELLLQAAAAAVAEGQKQTDASLLQTKEMMRKAGLAEAL